MDLLTLPPSSSLSSNLRPYICWTMSKKFLAEPERKRNTGELSILAWFRILLPRVCWEEIARCFYSRHSTKMPPPSSPPLLNRITPFIMYRNKYKEYDRNCIQLQKMKITESPSPTQSQNVIQTFLAKLQSNKISWAPFQDNFMDVVSVLSTKLSKKIIWLSFFQFQLLHPPCCNQFPTPNHPIPLSPSEPLFIYWHFHPLTKT